MAIYIECPSRPAKTLYDLNVEAGLSIERHLPTDPGPKASRREREWFAKELATYHRIRNAQLAEIVEPTPGPQFLCGEKVEQEPICACGHTAEMLCDYPMGKGKTCDLPVCWCCSRHIAEDRDLCLIHFAEFVGKAHAERIKPVAAEAVTLCGFGSSYRRGQQGWTDADRCRFVLDTSQPDTTVDGASPSRGADEVFHWQARAHFLARGLSVDRAKRCPMIEDIDGTHRGRFMNRNARMDREYLPHLGAGFITGRCGMPLSNGSANMAEVLRKRGVPVVVYRDDGIEPDPTPLDTLRALYALSRDAALVPAGLAVKAWTTGAPREEVVAALRFAREGSRWAPWIEAVEVAIR